MPCFGQLKCSPKKWLWSGAHTGKFITLCWTNSLVASLLWRGIVTVYFLSNLIYNYVVNAGEWEHFPLVYLTRWAELTNNLYALLAFCMVAYHKFKENTRMEQEASHCLKFIGFLWEVQSTIAIFITISYYTLLTVSWEYTSVNVHLSSSIIMVIDLVMIGMPRKFYHVWAAQIYVTTYVIANAGIWLACGEVVYPVLDWEKHDVRTVGIVFGVVFVALPILHGGLCILAIARDFLVSKLKGSGVPNTCGSLAVAEFDNHGYTRDKICVLDLTQKFG